MTKGEKPESAARIKRRTTVDIESYIKNLPPELQEKVRTCSSVEELLALAKEAKVPLPDEALAAIAGGEDSDSGNCTGITCPKCGSDDVSITGLDPGCYCGTVHVKCNKCGHEWDQTDFQ